VNIIHPERSRRKRTTAEGLRIVIERRHLLALGAGAAAGLLAGPAGAGEVTAPVMTDDGLYTQAWFLQSFLDLGEDLAEAAANGKRFAIIWEQKGCP
jgi:hypothetical protein